MIDLKEVLTKHSECLESKNKFNAVLNDIFTSEEDRKQIYFLSLIVQTPVLKTMQLSHSLEKMEIDNFVNLLKTKYGITAEKAFEILKIWSRALDVDFNYENQFIKNRKIIEQDFKDAFNTIQWDRNVSSRPCPFDCSGAAFLKRNGDYIEANREYIRLYKKHKVLHTDFALFWYKVLCCAGDILDALTLLGFALDYVDYSANEYNLQLLAHYYSLICAIEKAENSSITKYLKSVSGKSDYYIREEDCNVPLNKGLYKTQVDRLKNDEPSFYWYITNDLK